MTIVFAALLAIAGSSFGADEPVPVYEEPMHRLLFDSGEARVLELYVPPDATTLFHTHNSPLFNITISFAAIRLQRAGEEWRLLPAPGPVTGDVAFDDSYSSEPLTHRVRNVGDKVLHSILIINEHDAPAANAEVALPGVVNIDSPWFRQSRIELAGGEVVDWPGTNVAVFFVLVSDTHVTLTGPGGRQKFGMTWTGNFTPVPPGFPVRIANHSKETAILIAVAPL